MSNLTHSKTGRAFRLSYTPPFPHTHTHLSASALTLKVPLPNYFVLSITGQGKKDSSDALSHHHKQNKKIAVPPKKSLPPKAVPKTAKKLNSEVLTPVKPLAKQTSSDTPVKTVLQPNSATPLRVVVKEMSDTFLKDEMRQKSTTSKCYFMTDSDGVWGRNRLHKNEMQCDKHLYF